MRTVVASFVAALALAVPAGALAQPVSTMGGAGPDTYLELHLGAFLPQSNDLDSLDPKVSFGGLFGARFTPNVSVELAVDYDRASATSSGHVTRAFQDVPVTANLRLRYPMKVAELSVFAGGGIHFAQVSVDSDLTGWSSSNDTVFGYQLGAEVAFNLSPTMRVGFEVMRSIVSASFDGTSTDIGGLRLAATVGYHF
jgi:opacity protein-like surface antigen